MPKHSTSPLDVNVNIMQWDVDRIIWETNSHTPSHCQSTNKKRRKVEFEKFTFRHARLMKNNGKVQAIFLHRSKFRLPILHIHHESSFKEFPWQPNQQTHKYQRNEAYKHQSSHLSLFLLEYVEDSKEKRSLEALDQHPAKTHQHGSPKSQSFIYPCFCLKLDEKLREVKKTWSLRSEEDLEP